MKLKLVRKYKKDTYTIGQLFIDGVFFSNTVEDKDRGISQNMPLSTILSKKVKGETAIPTGTYKITLDVVSPRFGSKTFYKNICNGKLPRLLNVPGFDGVLIHCGNTAKDSAGCILVGKNKIKGGVTESRDTFEKLYQILSSDRSNISIEIV